MKIIQLRYFAEVCHYRNVTSAAKALFVSQPSVTAAIQSLEREFGVNLFYRQNKHMILTKEGEYFYQQALDILARVDETERSMKNFGNIDPHIKIGIPPMIGSFIFPQFFRDFKAAFPEVNLEIQEYGSLQTRQMIQTDMIDAAFVILDEIMPASFHVLPLMQTELVLAVSKNSPLASRRSVTVSDLADQPLILMREDSYQNSEIRNRFKEASITPNVLLHSSQIYMIKQFAHFNNTGTFLFQDIADQDPDLVGIELDPPLPISIGMIWKRGKFVYSGTSRFIEFTRKYDFKKAEELNSRLQKPIG